MICENNACQYYFFAHEVTYICCPKCGQIVKHNFAPGNPDLQARLMQELLPFQRYLKMSNRTKGAVWMGLILLALIEGACNSIALSNVSMNDESIGSLVVKMGVQRYCTAFFLLVCFGAIPLMSIAQRWSIRTLGVNVIPDSGFSFQQRKNEKAWFWHTLPGKSIILVLYLLFLIWIIRHRVPSYQQWNEKILPPSRYPQLAINQKLYFYVDLAYVSLVICFEQWDDWYRRHRCAQIRRL